MKKSGSQFVPIKPVVLRFTGHVTEPFHEYNGKKYIQVFLTPTVKKRIIEIEDGLKGYYKPGALIMNPRENDVLRIKVPYKYNRVSCEVRGLNPVQDFKVGQTVDVTVEFCGVWSVNDYTGPSWKLVSVEGL